MKIRVSLMVPYDSTAFILGSLVVICVWVNYKNLHRLVDISLYPIKMVFPSLVTFTLCLVKVNSHSLSHKTGIGTKGSCMSLNLYPFFAFFGIP